MPEETKRKYVLLAPNGYFAGDVLAHAYKGCWVTDFDEHGNVDDWQLGDTPDFETYSMDNGDVVLLDNVECTEWLASHCRILSVNEEFEIDDYDNQVISPWPEHIQKLCHRVRALHDVVRHVNIARRNAPVGFEDTTTAKVLDAVVIGRCDAEIGSLQRQIDEFRKTDPRVVMPDEEEEEADA